MKDEGKTKDELTRELEDLRKEVAKLKESEERYKTIFSTISSAVLVSDPETLDIIDANDAACLFYSYTREEFLQLKLTAIHTLDKEHIVKLVKEVREEQRAHVETRHVTRTGQLKEVEVYPGSILIGKKTYLCSIVHDITERKAMEEQVRLAKEMLNNVTEGVILVRASDATIVYTNPAFDTLLGYEPGELAGQHISVVNAPTERDPRETAFQIIQSLKDNGVWQGEILNITKEGKPLWCHSTVSTFEHATHGTVWVSIHSDISQRKELEIHLLKEKKLSQAMIDAMPGVFYLFDDTGKYLLWNKNLETISGFTHDEITCKNPLDFFTGGDRDAVARAIHDVFNKGIGYVEAHFHTRDGRHIPYYFNGLVTEADGRKCIIGMGIDVSEQKKMEKEIREMNLNLQHKVAQEVEKNRMKDQMMYEQTRHLAMGDLLVNIAHQWRQPLSAIGLLVQDIKDAYLHNELNQEYLDDNIKTLMSELQDLSKTIDDFKNLYHTGTSRAPFNPCLSIRHSLSIIENHFTKIGAAIDLHADGTLELYGYESDFSQVVLILLNNIRDVFSERQVVCGTVQIDLYKDASSGRIVMKMKDNGGGIDKDIIHRIFDPYFTTKHKARGTGLGLYMARIIVENQLKGTINAKSENGWCEFRIEI